MGKKMAERKVPTMPAPAKVEVDDNKVVAADGEGKEDDMAKWHKADWEKSMMPDDDGFAFDFGGGDVAGVVEPVAVAVVPRAQQGDEAGSDKVGGDDDDDDGSDESSAAPAPQFEDMRRILKAARKTLAPAFYNTNATEKSEEVVEAWKQKRRIWRGAVASQKPKRQKVAA